jgi:hypothetical protein
MTLTGAGLIQEKSYHHFRFALTFDRNKVMRTEFKPDMTPAEVAYVLRELADKIESLK